MALKADSQLATEDEGEPFNYTSRELNKRDGRVACNVHLHLAIKMLTEHPQDIAAGHTHWKHAARAVAYRPGIPGLTKKGAEHGAQRQNDLSRRRIGRRLFPGSAYVWETDSSPGIG